MNKKIILGAGGLVVLLGLGGGGWMFLKKAKASKENPPAGTEPGKGEGKGAETGKKEETEEEALDVHGKPVAPSVVVYRNIVNLDRKNAYLKVEFNIFVKDAELGKQLTSDKPNPELSEFRAMMLSILSGKTLEEAADLETRESICEEIKEKLNEKFAPKPSRSKEEEDPKHKRPKKPIKDVLVVDWAISS